MAGHLNLVYVLAAAVTTLIVVAFLAVLYQRCYKRCPEGQLLVVYGRVPGGSVVLDSGRFVFPLIQDSCYVSLGPFELAARSQGGFPRAVRVGSTAKHRRVAGLQLLGLSHTEVVAMVEEILDQTGPNAQLLEERLSELGLETV
jgi:hypothetical protein